MTQCKPVRPMTAGRHKTPQTATGHYF